MTTSVENNTFTLGNFTINVFSFAYIVISENVLMILLYPFYTFVYIISFVYFRTGMYDMLGNVWEWTTTKYYQRGVDRLKQPRRFVLKGGSYMDTRDGSANQVVRTSNRYVTEVVKLMQCSKQSPNITFLLCQSSFKWQ